MAQTAVTGLAADGSVTAGSSVTFLASADGYPAPAFQWRKNGTSIPGATASVLTISSVTLSDAATYSVVATNASGSAISPDEVLVVQSAPTNVAPAITTQPVASQSVVAGGSASFSVAASGTPSPTFQWQKDGVPMAGATNATLTLASLTTSDSGTYTAVATNVAGSATSTGSVLTVTAAPSNPPPAPTEVAPVITTQPIASQSVTAGGSVTFTVAASGTPAPTFQWWKSGITITGATNSTLTLSSLTSSDAASYYAVATNSVGSATSSTALLTVTEPSSPPPPPPPTTTTAGPVITTQPPATQTITAGSPATISVVASGSPSPSYQWRKNGTNIAGGTGATLTFNAITSADAATYTVLVSNSAGSAVSDGSVLVVRMPPLITTQPTSQSVASGATARFTVAVSAIPGATLQWQKNGQAISGATSSTLTLSSISSADTGSYTVVASNTLGSVTSRTASLSIAAPPVITSQPVSQTVDAKANVTFAVTASGSPTPTYQWKKNGNSIPGATAATLALKSVNKADGGTYSVDVSNIVGWASSNRVTLSVNGSGKGSNEDDSTADTLPVVEGVPTSSRLANLSVRAVAGNGNNGLIVGFVINGTASKPVLIRGIGPALRDFGVTGVLADPSVSLYSGAAVTATNDDWMSSDNAPLIASTSARVGAFSLADQASDSALMATLGTGAYTAQLTGKDAGNGIALIEVYDTASGTTATATKLVNLSVRAQIGTGAAAPNMGFVITGTGPKRVMIRAVGPTLASFGVGDAIADPQLELFQGDVRINQNDNWGGSSSLSAVFSQVGAFGFSDTSSRDAVLLATLEPGAYTVVASGVNGSTGVGLVELYEIP